MIPTDNGRQLVLLLKGWVRKPETRGAMPPIGKHGRLDSEGLRYLSFDRGRRRLHPAIGNAPVRRLVGIGQLRGSAPERVLRERR
jgi:hypothetical protein